MNGGKLTRRRGDNSFQFFNTLAQNFPVLFLYVCNKYSLKHAVKPSSTFRFEFSHYNPASTVRGVTRSVRFLHLLN
jgi:hypothetical protein